MLFQDGVFFKIEYTDSDKYLCIFAQILILYYNIYGMHFSF